MSGFFMRRGWWVKGLLLIYVLPWAVPALPTFISIHWMLNGQWGLLNNFLWNVFGVDGPGWIETSRWLALGSVIVSHIWKWLPFWTVILLAGRMAIPQELYDAAEVDGATRFQHSLLRLRWRTGVIYARIGYSWHPRCLRGRSARTWSGGGNVGAATDDPADHYPDAQAAHDRGTAVSAEVKDGRSVRREPHYRLRRYLTEAAAMGFGILVVIWTLVPIYNMVAVALESRGDVFTNDIWPAKPSLDSFWIVATQGYWYLEYFWHQFGNSLYVGVATVFLTLLIGSLVSFSIGRMRLRHGWIVSNAALLTYVIPSSFLAIPFYRIMQKYGLANDLWSVIAAEVTFATPYAIFIFQQYGVSIPIELDEAARIDGASPVQVYLYIYLPLMAPALVAVGTYALLLAWNEYLYQFLLLSSKKNMTVPVALAQFLNSDEAPWNYMMATAIVYALPPVAIYYAFRRRMTAGLTMGGVKG
jgi:multiple sugar transport system permease protein